MSYDEMGLTLSLCKVFINIPHVQWGYHGAHIITMLKTPWKFPRWFQSFQLAIFFSGFHKLVTKSSRQIVEITNMLGQIISWAAQRHLGIRQLQKESILGWTVGRDSPPF